MKKALFLVLMSTIYTLSAFAGALRVSDGRGETVDYAITAASLKNGTVTLEARKYKRGANDNLEETERKYFNVSNDVLKTSGIESGSLISIVLNKNIRGDVFCSVENFASKRSANELSCDSLVVSASSKE